MTISTMLGVLKDKSLRQKKQIEKILSKPKSERNKKILKLLLRENKSAKKILKQAKQESQNDFYCPHCCQLIEERDKNTIPN